jgi:dihydrolipoamide dehydrogenase
MRELSCDVAVIGAGTAGIAAHRAAREAGARAVLIEAGPGGTTCARVGCMPSKLLTVAGRAAHDARAAHRFGVRVPDVAVDGPAVLGHLRAERDRFVRHVFEGLDALPADERLDGQARFLDGETLAVADHTRIRFRAAVIATGSSPSLPNPL